MESSLTAVLGLLVAVLAVTLAVYVIRVRGRQSLEGRFERFAAEIQGSIASNLQLLAGQTSGVTNAVNDQLSSMAAVLQSQSGQLNERLDNAARIMGQVKGDLGALSGATKELSDIGKDISSLQEILRAPKLRGGLGEFLLAELLKDCLPPAHYELQHTFRNGKRVDAVIKIGGGLVPVDSKFPLENFSRIIESKTDEERVVARKSFIADCRRHIDAIADAYIQPGEGTFNFALMYIPAENVYYETIIKDASFGDDKHVSGYAFTRRVIPVSPGSFYAYLQTILLGLRGFEVSERAKEIINHLDMLGNSCEGLLTDLDVLGRHINNAKAKYDEVVKRADRFRLAVGGLAEPAEQGQDEEDIPAP